MHIYGLNCFSVSFSYIRLAIHIYSSIVVNLCIVFNPYVINQVANIEASYVPMDLWDNCWSCLDWNKGFEMKSRYCLVDMNCMRALFRAVVCSAVHVDRPQPAITRAMASRIRNVMSEVGPPRNGHVSERAPVQGFHISVNAMPSKNNGPRKF